MKYYFTLLILLVTSIAAIAQERKKISEEEFNKHYADRFEIVGENIEIQRVFQFSDIDKEELYRRARPILMTASKRNMPIGRATQITHTPTIHL